MNIDFGLELAPVCRENLEQMRQWRNNHDVWRHCRQNDLISDVDQDAWFLRQSADPTIRMYVIIRRVDGARVPVGVCGLTSIDLICRRAELSMYIGPEHHKKGYGREAFKLLFIHGFLNLGLHQIWIETIGTHPADKLFTELGFVPDGVRRDFYYKDGRHVDAHLYSILRQEWISAQLASSSSSPAASSPTPSSSERGLPEGAIMDVVPIKSPRRRGPGKSKAPNVSPLSSATSEPGNSNKRSAANDDHPPHPFPSGQPRRGAILGPVTGVGQWESADDVGHRLLTDPTIGTHRGAEGGLAAGVAELDDGA